MTTRRTKRTKRPDVVTELNPSRKSELLCGRPWFRDTEGSFSTLAEFKAAWQAHREQLLKEWPKTNPPGRRPFAMWLLELIPEFGPRKTTEYYEKLKGHYTEARTFLINILQETGFKPHIPKGAYYTIADVSDLMEKLEVADDVSFSRKLIELTGVATVPGSAFYSVPEMGNKQVRFCFCKKWETLHAVDKLLRRLVEKRRS